ncbi:MAG: IclR family transcriptional regulator, partial [Phototrophicales bacterium]
KVMLANLSPEECKRRLDNVDLKPCTKRSLHDVKVLLAELEQVRQQGYALNDGELSSGLRAVAAPIFDKQHVIAAINVSGSIDVISERRMRDELPPYVVET